MEALNPAKICHTSPYSPAVESRPSTLDYPQSDIMPCSPSPSPPRSDESIADPDSLLNDLVRANDDLRAWLEHTGFWDTAYRQTILADVRQLQGLELEKAKVLTRIRDSKPSADPAADSTALLPVATPSHAQDGPLDTSTSTLALQARYTPTGPIHKHPSPRPAPRKGEKNHPTRSTKAQPVS